jgi:predicted transcriptional regulator
MKVKKIKIGIKNVKTALNDFVRTGEAIEQGKKVKKEAGVYFTSLEAFRKALTPKRLELLHIIKTRKPSSINELARFAKRDIKNVADDLKYLGQIGLIEREETDRKTKPVITLPQRGRLDGCEPSQRRPLRLLL